MKKFLILFFIFIGIKGCVFAESDLFNLNTFAHDVQKYSDNEFVDKDVSTMINELKTGKLNLSATTIFQKIANIFLKELKLNINLIVKIIMIIIFCAILKNIQGNFGSKGVAEIAFFACYILIIAIAVSSFIDIVKTCGFMINSLTGFMEIVTPILITLLLVTGNISIAGVVQPVLLVMIQLVGTVISKFVLPLLMASFALNIVGNISEKVQISKLTGFLKGITLGIMGIGVTVFMGLLSLEGSIASTVDGITAKTAKAAVSTFVPVAGKVLSDTIDTIMGSTVIIKDAIGVIGVLIIIGICIVPIIKVLILMGIFNLSAAIAQPIADDRIMKVLSGVSDTLKLVFSLMVTCCILFIISITVIIKLSNSAFMFR